MFSADEMTSDKTLEASAPVHGSSYADKQPPPFGHPLLEYFSFDPGYINLNNGPPMLTHDSFDNPERDDILGSYGAIPLPVSEACRAISDEVEANPDKFIRLTYEARWIRCRERVAKLIGAEVDECVLVPNATHGVGTVLRNIDWKKGDVIIKSTDIETIFREEMLKYFSQPTLLTVQLTNRYDTSWI